MRGLYENSVVPVREIARLAGVTERTLYKYVERGGWRRRHACAARDAAVAAANRGRRCAPGAGFAPVKGAGGRFIVREDADKPHAHGLKALDPEGAQHAAAACLRAGNLADAAADAAAAAAQERAARVRAEAARVRAEKEVQAQLRAFELLAGALLDLAKLQVEGGEPPGKRAARLALRLHGAIDAQLGRLVTGAN